RVAPLFPAFFPALAPARGRYSDTGSWRGFQLFGKTSDCYFHDLALALAHDLDIDLPAYLRLRDDAWQPAHRVAVLAVELEDHVAFLDARLCRRTVRRNARHQSSRIFLDVVGFRQIVGDRLNINAQPAATS